MLGSIGFFMGVTLVALPAWLLLSPGSGQATRPPAAAVTAVETVPEPPAPPPGGPPVPVAADPPPPPRSTPESAVPPPAPAPGGEAAEAVTEAAERMEIAETAEMTEPATPPPLPPPKVQLLWSPFHSEAAARGFARRLTRVSGVDVRIAEAVPGHYRVGFDYRDDIEKNWILGQIAARTGLALQARQKPGSPTDGTEDHEAEPRHTVADAPSAAAADGGGADRRR